MILFLIMFLQYVLYPIIFGFEERSPWELVIQLGKC